MDRDRLTSRGWTWHQGLVRFLDVEEAMFQCTGGCKSCDEHSEELESATQYATRSIRQPVPHMDAVAGEKLRAMSNRALGNELDRWADARDRFPKLDSIALRLTAERLRRMTEGCDHPAGYIWRTETEDFCQQCGAVVDELTGPLSPRFGGSRADGSMFVPRTACGVRTQHDSHGVMDSYCSGLLLHGSDEAEDVWGDDEDGDDTIGGYDDADSGGPWHAEDAQVGQLNKDMTGSGIWWKAHDGVESYEMHFHAGSRDHGGTVDATTHRHYVYAIQFCSDFKPHRPHTHNQGARFCAGLNRAPLPETRCALRIRHEAHDWPKAGVSSRPTRHCDGKGRR